MFIPGVDIVGGYSICSTPEQLLMNHQIQLAVKYSEHPPAHWVHTKVGYSICSTPEQLLMGHQIQLAVKYSEHLLHIGPGLQKF